MRSAFLICNLRAYRSTCLGSISANDDWRPIDRSIPNHNLGVTINDDHHVDEN